MSNVLCSRIWPKVDGYNKGDTLYKHRERIMLTIRAHKNYWIVSFVSAKVLKTNSEYGNCGI